MCREHGRQLSTELSLAAPSSDNEDAGTGSPFNLWAVIKETNVDNGGLLDFHENYFKYDTYRDENLELFRAMGNRKIKLSTWNPLRLYRGFKRMSSRLSRKNIGGNLKGEGLIQGGVLVFDKDGNLAFAYEEEIGDELVIDDIRRAMLAIEGEKGGDGDTNTPDKDEL